MILTLGTFFVHVNGVTTFSCPTLSNGDGSLSRILYKIGELQYLVIN